MSHNLGRTSLKKRGREGDAMREFESLPAPLRKWVAGAMLPWRPGSVRRAYRKALERTGCPETALRELDAMEHRLVAKDAARVWGAAHPFASGWGE
ncbi:DUF6525 family protein [Pseudoroseicyclus sp. H15]